MYTTIEIKVEFFKEYDIDLVGKEMVIIVAKVRIVGRPNGAFRVGIMGRRSQFV